MSLRSHGDSEARRKMSVKKNRITPTRAALKASKESGYVVVGFLHNEIVVPESMIGLVLSTFAGKKLPNHVLKITSLTDRAEWEAQAILLFGNARHDTCPPADGESFYRCELMCELMSHRMRWRRHTIASEMKSITVDGAEKR